jgi:hypothetical protein
VVTSIEQIKKLEEILKGVKGKEIGALEAFLQLRQILQPDDAQGLSNANDSIERLKKRFQFWSFELSSVNLNSLTPKERLLFLRRYFFEDKAKVLKKAIAPQILMGLALQNFANLTGLSLNFVLLGKHLALKTEIEGEFQYISLDENGRLLDTQEVLDLIFNFGKIRRIDFSDLVLAYLEYFQNQLDPKKASNQILRIYDLILSLRTADPKTLLRRAYLYKELGYISEALADLKRYLNFQPSEPLAKSIRKFYSQL